MSETLEIDIELIGALIGAAYHTLTWASTPGNHGGNPYTKPHVKAAEKAINLLEKRRMTRKDFQLIADVLRAEVKLQGWDDPPNDLHELAGRFADALATTNPRFDRERFLKTALG